MTAFPVSSALFAGTRSRSHETVALGGSTTVVVVTSVHQTTASNRIGKKRTFSESPPSKCAQQDKDRED